MHWQMIGSRVLAVALLLAVAVFSLASLALGASYLSTRLFGVLPFGNVLAAAALSALAAVGLLLAAGPGARRFSSLALMASLAWLPVSSWLAGNFALNFSGNAGVAWLALTSGVALLVVTSLVFAWVARLRARRTRGAT